MFSFNWLVFGIVSLVLLLFLRHEKWQLRNISAMRTAERLREQESRQRHKTLKWQENLGNRFGNALDRAVAEHPDISIRVGRIENNGPLGYSVVVGRQGIGIVQVDINLFQPEDKQIHVFWAPYGPDAYCTTDEAEVKSILDLLVESIRNYTHAYR